MLVMWHDFFKELTTIVVPSLLVMITCFLLFCLEVPMFFMLSGVLYFFIAGVCRELFWLCDYLTAQTTGYHAMMGELWSHIQKPPTRWTTIKMYYLWIAVFKPTYECRVHRLKKKYQGVGYFD